MAILRRAALAASVCVFGLTPLASDATGAPREASAAPSRDAPSAVACEPVEVAPDVWVTPRCTELSTFPFADDAEPPERAHPLVGGANGGGAVTLPASVDLRARGLDGPVKDQGRAGVCWAFAISSVMDNALRREGETDVVAPLHVIADDLIQHLSDAGGAPAMVSEATWPYDWTKACKLGAHSDCKDGTSGTWRSDALLVAERARADASGRFRVTGHRRLAAKPGRPDEVAAMLADGRAIYADVRIDMKAWSARGLGKDGVIADWQPTVGHAVTLVGYRPSASGREFLVQNSWGPKWAAGGYAWISERMLHDNLAYALALDVAEGPPPGKPQKPDAPPVTPPPKKKRRRHRHGS